MPLKAKTISGVKWTTLSQAVRLGLQFVTMLILARLLIPSDFGLLGMAMVVIGFAGIFKDLGMSYAVIQRSELSDSLLSSVFWLNLGIGFCVMVLLYVGSNLGGILYHEAKLPLVLKWLSVTFFLSSISAMQQALLMRKLQFKQLAHIEILASVCASIVAVVMAYMEFGVWSLVAQTLVGISVTTVLLWSGSNWYPRCVFMWSEIKSIIRYSLNLTGANVFDFFAANMDYLLIGRFLGAEALGYYTLAYKLLLFPIVNIAGVIGRVMFPAFSTLQEDHERFRRMYLKTVSSIAFIAFPLMAGLFVLAEPFILTVFGVQWESIIILLLIFSPLGVIQCIGTTVGAIYNATGRTDWAFRWSLFANSYMVISIFIGLQWGIVGVALSYTLASFSIAYLSFSIPFKLIELKFKDFLKVLSLPFFNALMMGVVLFSFQWFVPLGSISNSLLLMLSVVMGGVSYGVLSWVNNSAQIRDLWSLLKNRNEENKV